MKSISTSLFIILLCIFGCTKDNLNLTISTSDLNQITTTSVNCGGEIITSDSTTINEFGICLSKSGLPTIKNEKIKSNSKTLVFKVRLERLVPKTTYFVRAYVINTEGTFYSDEKTFTTLDSIVTDIEGNKYHTITIGTQVWTAENLKVTKLNDGTEIPNWTVGFDWGGTYAPAYCWFKNNIDNKAIYGALYNWYTVNTHKICPVGWHVPSDSEWTTLEVFLRRNGYNYDGTIDIDTNGLTKNKLAISLAADNGWELSTNDGAVGNTDYSAYRNKSGFTGLPGGCRHGYYTWANFGTFGYWLSSSEYSNFCSWYRYMRSSQSDFYREINAKHDGMSIRCLHD